MILQGQARGVVSREKGEQDVIHSKENGEVYMQACIRLLLCLLGDGKEAKRTHCLHFDASEQRAAHD